MNTAKGKARKTVCYTVVYEDYDVDVFRSAKSVCDYLGDSDLALENTNFADGEPQEASEADIARAIRKDSIVHLYPLDGGDWKYRIQKQYAIR